MGVAQISKVSSKVPWKVHVKFYASQLKKIEFLCLLCVLWQLKSSRVRLSALLYFTILQYFKKKYFKLGAMLAWLAGI